MSALIKQLEIARRYGDLSDIAFHFAELLGRLDPTAGDPLRLAAALVSQRTGSGHVCVHLPDEADRRLLTNDNDLNITAPPLAEWMAVLKKSRVVTMSGEYRPLVLEPDGRLYLYRYWDWEKRLAEDLLVRAQLPDLDIDDNALSQALTAVFPAGLGSSDQKVAAALSVFRPLSVITGGPGSGKTTTVVRTVALLQAITGMPADAFTLAAPTGKAAARLREVFVQSATLPGLENLQLPEHTTTIHRLLGIHAADGNPVHDARNPLTCRVLVVDEASMIDLGLMVKLVEAMPRHARLILLGDRDQLASVEAGSVLEDICNGAQGLPEALAARLSRVTGVHDVSGATPGNAAPLAGSLAVLQDSWRYDRTSDIG
ncbi:MAG: AAA family ATPase, partial [Pseudomonadota bacterium]